MKKITALALLIMAATIGRSYANDIPYKGAVADLMLQGYRVVSITPVTAFISEMMLQKDGTVAFCRFGGSSYGHEDMGYNASCNVWIPTK